ncbi:hypothetical protein K0C01_02470 [Salinarchaeum sp. IM2453]|uniref:hypothetical protein n=1 Tax=Salinarchaeum sp. IM2453 TaxID=2862870 RepID=UPI001C832F91|nr:hypothetical protein [Salinarchaeum sp. IM2453]QZA89047.1 hypothetical protein K0C01_02470 [Salinarchaeum sp. IM2453]
MTFVFAHDLIKAHSNGEVTIRQIEALTGLSSGLTYDLVEALYEIHDLGDGESETFSPTDSAEEAVTCAIDSTKSNKAWTEERTRPTSSVQ